MIKPFLAIMSPRDIPKFEEQFHKIDYVDKVWFKYMDIVKVHEEIYKYFMRHPEYTHVILVSDDGISSYNDVAMLIADAEKYDFPVIGGACIIDSLADDKFLAVTLDKVIDNIGDDVERANYKCLPYEFLELNSLIKCWFNGNALQMIRRDVVKKIGFTFPNERRKTSYSEAGDLTLNFHINKVYEQYVDLRLRIDHLRYPLHTPPFNSMVGKVDSKIIEEKATAEVPKMQPAEILTNIPKKYMDLMDLNYGPQRVFNIAIVTEFEQKDFFQWYTAFCKMNNTKVRFGNFFQTSNERGHIINIRPVIIDTFRLEKYDFNHEYWNDLKNADLVFVYSVRINKTNSWEWYNLPQYAKRFMKPSAKMIAQFDDEFSWFLYKFWKEPFMNENLSMDDFFKKTKVLEVADAYFTVLDNPFWAYYTKKPVFYMPLPQLSRYPEIISPRIKTSVFDFSTIRGQPELLNSKNQTQIALMLHSIQDSNVSATLNNVVHPLNISAIIFSTKNSGKNKVEGRDIFYSRMPRSGYMNTLKKATVSIDDDAKYNGWSRFVLESALNCVPCVGSTIAVKELFPDLYTAHNDFEKQKALITQLLNDQNFYTLQKHTGWIRAVTKLSDSNLVSKFLQIAVKDLGYQGSDFKELKVDIKIKDTYKVLLVSTFCNESHSIPKYMEALRNMDYPKENIDLLWVENNSSDGTWKILLKYYEEFKSLGYSSHRLQQNTCKNYGSLEKPTIKDFVDGKTVMDSDESRRLRNDHIVSIWNGMYDAMTDEHDFILFWFPDTIPESNMIKRYIKDLINHPECGWISCVYHWRYPNHIRPVGGSPIHLGLESPTFKIDENNPLPPDYKYEWIIKARQYGLPYDVIGATEEEVIRRQKIKDGVCEVACTGHIWMNPRSVVKAGLRIRLYALEAAYAADIDLSNMGLKMMCDTNVFVKHISVDGIIYADKLCSWATKEMLANDEETIGKREIEFIDFVLTLRTKSIPRKPVGTQTVMDNNFRKILDLNLWNKYYGEFVDVIDNVDVYGELMIKATQISKERRKHNR